MSQPKHVVMVVANDVRTDTRVRKSALALADAGWRVTVVGAASDGQRTESELGPVRLIRVPVRFSLRDDRTAKRATRRARRPPLRYATTQREQAARFRIEAIRRNALVTGRNPRVSVRWRRFVIRARSGGAKRVDSLAVKCWRLWDKVMGRQRLFARWRSIVPEADDYDLSLGPVLDSLEPDVVHAHDVQVVALAARAAARARATGRACPWVYDAHEWVVGLSQYGGRTPRVIAGWADLESDYVRDANRVVTVSPDLARALKKRYRLRAEPTVVMNIPPDDALSVGIVDIRETLSLGADVPLVVYSGGVQAARGLDSVVAAMPQLPDVHLAIVAVPTKATHAVSKLLESATALGVADRVHALDPVAPHEVSAFLRTADIGLIPLLHFGSHEMALANKIFEYLHAQVPMVVSDCAAQERFVTDHGFGLVHRANDPKDIARAIREVLADPSPYRAALAAEAQRQRYVWRHEADELVGLYTDLVGAPPAGAAAGTPTSVEVVETPRQRPKATHPVLGIGPANSAGQAWAWAEAARMAVPGLTHEVVMVDNGKLDFPSDVDVSQRDYANNSGWGLQMTERAIASWTHVLFEAGRPIFGITHGRDFRADAALLRDAGIKVGLVFHGSEIRSPERDAADDPYSPFSDPKDSFTALLQRRFNALAPSVAAFDGPKFVSTLDLLTHVPDAQWLPVVVDSRAWPKPVELFSGVVPVVAHLPSNRALKGTEVIEAALEPFIAAGRIKYERVEGLPPPEVPAVLARVDIVVDQLLNGYGVLACEGMSLGRVVMGRVPAKAVEFLGHDVPIVPVTPDTIADQLERVLSDREWACGFGANGLEYVREYHDGRRSGAVLAAFVGEPDAGASTSV